MAYLKELIVRLGKTLGIKPASSAVSVGAPIAHRDAAVQETVVEQPASFEAPVANAAAAPTIAGE